MTTLPTKLELLRTCLVDIDLHHKQAEFASKLLHGFTTAVLQQKAEAKANMSEASHFSEKPYKGGLFLISKEAPEISQPSIREKQKAARTKRRNRKTVTHKNIFVCRGKNYPVNPAKSGLYIEILESMINQFELAVQKWGRVFVLRFDLHQYFYCADNKRISAFINRLSTKLKRIYGFTEIGYCWVREKERAKAQHYHFVLFLEGRKIKHSSRINQFVVEAWEEPTGSYHVPTIKRPFYYGNGEQITDDVIYRVSYLAKVRGKGYRNKQAKDFQCSRMRSI